MGTHEIVILGANFAGINLVHHLLRQTVPALSNLDASQNYHITLVSPNSHFYFKIAGPRALINATAIPSEDIFKPIEESLAQYGSTVTFALGKAVGLDPKERIVRVEKAREEVQEVRYNTLFICTGSTSASPLWTLHDGGHEVTKRALENMHTVLPKAKTVLIGGAGPVGVETAGEIAYHYPSAKITLVVGDGLLQSADPATSTKAMNALAAAGVEVVSSRVVSTSTGVNGTRVDLSDGSSKDVDVYIDARGAEKVNSEFLPSSWLDSSGRVITRDAYFRVKGDGPHPPITTYVIGDIVSSSSNTAIELDAQVPTAASAFAVDVAAQLGKDTNAGGMLSWLPFVGKKGIALKEFKPMRGTIVVPIGPEGGVGQLIGWQIPSFMVKKVKSEKFLMELVEPLVSGARFAKA